MNLSLNLSFSYGIPTLSVERPCLVKGALRKTSENKKKKGSYGNCCRHTDLAGVVQADQHGV